MDETEIILIICGTFIVICLLIIFVGMKQFRGTPFKINKRYLSDGSIQLEVQRFGNKKKNIMDEFYRKYSIGNKIFFDGKEFLIIDMKKVRRDTMFSSQYVMNIYLEDAK